VSKTKPRGGPFSKLFAGWTPLEGGLAVVAALLAILLGGIWQYRRRAAAAAGDEEGEELPVASE
jgi:hypothetical protein